jgi:hypothetical protein
MIHDKIKHTRGMLSLLLLFTSACAGGGAPTEAPSIGDTAPPAAEDNPCANPYYPVRQGASWTYTSTGSGLGDTTWTDTITSVRSDGFTLTSQYPDLMRTQEWACRPEGLVALQLGGGPAGSLTTGETNLVMNTRNASGVTYPKEIAPGQTWSHTLDYTGEMNIAGQPADAVGDAKAGFTAIAFESVTVPAGTFNAIKVEVQQTININATFQGVTVPVTFSGMTTSWYAEGVGWIKSVTAGNFADTAFTDTIELQSYNIP